MKMSKPKNSKGEIYLICLKDNTKKGAILLIQTLLQCSSSNANYFSQNYTFWQWGQNYIINTTVTKFGLEK